MGVSVQELKHAARLQELEPLPDADRQRQRQLLSKPIVDEYYAWLETIFRPAGKLKKAVTYSLNQREYLCAFLDHGEIEISNNQVENAIRPIVVGRKTGSSATLRPEPMPAPRSSACWKRPRLTG